MNTRELDISNHSLDELVFENRNKTYGAFYLRMKSPIHSIAAFGIAMVVFLLIVFANDIQKLLKGNQAAVVDVVEMEVEVELKDVSMDEKVEEPMPEPMKIEPPKIEVVKFLPPEFKPNVTNEDDLKKTTELDETNVGKEDKEGEKGLNEDIVETGNGNASYPHVDEQKGIQGTVHVRFVVMKDGSIDRISVARGISPTLDAEAIRLAKLMPKWIPAKLNGTAVNSNFIMQVKFTLPE
jgi:protein TonB